MAARRIVHHVVLLKVGMADGLHQQILISAQNLVEFLDLRPHPAKVHARVALELLEHLLDLIAIIENVGGRITQILNIR